MSRPELPPAEVVQPALDPDQTLTRDLQTDPPPGFPKLTVKAEALVKRRITHPLESWEAAKRATGYAPLAQVSSKVRLYCRGIAAWRPPGTESAADQRTAAVDRLMRVIRHGEDREATMAAKVLEGYLPKLDNEEAKPLAESTTYELLDRLRQILSRIGLGDLEELVAVTDGKQRTSGATSFPRQGNEVNPGVIDAN